MQVRFPKYDLLGMPLLGIAAATLFIIESRRQLRKRTRPKTERLIENGSVAAAALPALRLLLVPGMYAAAKLAQKKNFGLFNFLTTLQWFRYLAGFLLLDYTNYLWHVLLHKSDLLWRFHNVHHIDLDLDLSTAWRFHIGENIFSVPYRGAAVALIGVPPSLVLWYEVFFEGCTAFHHSNIRLPYEIERRLNLLNVPQDEITIGVPAYRNPEEQSPKHLFLMPFTRQRLWQLPDGTVPERKGKYPLNQLCP